MRIQTKLAALVAMTALGAAPALALGTASSTAFPTKSPASHPANPGSEGNHGNSNKPATPGPSAPLPAKAKAFGRLCQGESKQHVAGTPGTAFSKCVTDMAKLANGSSHNPRAACKDESKKHIAGQRGTPFSRCVSAAAKLHKH